MSVAARLPPDGAGAALVAAAKVAFTHALQVTLSLCAAVSIAAAVLVVVALRRAPERDARGDRSGVEEMRNHPRAETYVES